MLGLAIHLREQGVGGSNPLAPTNKVNQLRVIRDPSLLHDSNLLPESESMS